MTSRRAWLIGPCSPLPGEGGGGGVKTHTVLLTALLRGLGWEVSVLLPRGVSAGAAPEGVTAEEVPCGDAPHSAAWRAALRLKAGALLESAPPDLVISEGYYAAGLEDLLSGRGIPLAAFVHNFHLVHFSTALAEVDGPRSLASYLFRTVPRLLLRILASERPFLARAGLVISVSDRNAGLLRRVYRLAPEKVVTLHNWAQDGLFAGAGEERARVRAELSIAERDEVFLLLGNLWRPKGFHVAIEAFGKLPAAARPPVLLIAGAGVHEEKLRALAGKNPGAGRIIFAGPWPHSGLGRLFGAADIFVFPSILPEGHAYALLEAMAAGLPVIATRTGGNTETLEGGAGLLVPPSDAAALSRAMADLLSDREKRARLGAAARARAKAAFSERAAAEGLRAILEKLEAGRD